MRASAIAARAMAEPGAFPPPPRDHARRRNELWREQAEYLGGVLERRLAAAEQRRLPPPPSRRSHLVRPRSPARFDARPSIQLARANAAAERARRRNELLPPPPSGRSHLVRPRSPAPTTRPTRRSRPAGSACSTKMTKRRASTS